MGESEHKMIAENALLDEPPRPRRWSRKVLGYTIAAVCLYWVLRDLDLRELVRRIARDGSLLGGGGNFIRCVELCVSGAALEVTVATGWKNHGAAHHTGYLCRPFC